MIHWEVVLRTVFASEILSDLTRISSQDKVIALLDMGWGREIKIYTGEAFGIPGVMVKDLKDKPILILKRVMNPTELKTVAGKCVDAEFSKSDLN